MYRFHSNYFLNTNFFSKSLYMKIEFLILLDQLFEQGNLSVLLRMFLLLYGGNAKPKLPNFVDKLFNYAVFRIFILIIIVYKGNYNALHFILISIL